MKKALSFLGTGKYNAVTYVWPSLENPEARCRTKLFPIAVYEIFHPDEIVVFVTQKAKIAKGNEDQKPYLDQLQEKLGVIIRPIDIPDGRSVEELWEIFNACVSSVETQDEIILDITHAFRSIPMFAFAVAAYLRQTKRINIKHIVYGAFEARQLLDKEELAPVFDLSLLLDLLDWLSATDHFINRGDPMALGSILFKTKTNLWKQTKSSRESIPKFFSKAGGALQDLSRSLCLVQPCQIMACAQNLTKILDKAKEEFEKWALPFTTILDNVSQAVSSLAYDNPEILDAQNLKVQINIIEYLLTKGFYMQAVSLAREWVVSWVIWKSGRSEWIKNWKNNKEVREPIEKALGIALALQKPKKTKYKLPDWFKPLEYKYQLGDIWGWLTNLRNTIDHCGMQKNVPKINTLENNLKEIPEKIDRLFESL